MAKKILMMIMAVVVVVKKRTNKNITEFFNRLALSVRRS